MTQHEYTLHIAMDSLPDDIQGIVQDMACLKQHNGSPSRYGLIAVLDVDHAQKIEGGLHEQLDAWVYDCLAAAHGTLDAGVRWDFVSNVMHDQWNGDDTDSEGEVVEDRLNTYCTCVHIDHHDNGRYDDRLFHYDYVSRGSPVNPAQVLEHFTSPPQHVRGVNISGVNERIISEQWAECIAKDANFTQYDRPGMGYMLHPMYTLQEDFQPGSFPRLFTRREMSFNFGWPDYIYPGRRGTDW